MQTHRYTSQLEPAHAPHSGQRIPVGPSGHTDARLGLRCRSWSQPQSLCTAQQPHLDAPLQCERSAHTLQGVEVDQAGKGHVPRFDGGGHTGPQEPIFGSRRDHPCVPCPKKGVVPPARPLSEEQPLLAPNSLCSPAASSQSSSGPRRSHWPLRPAPELQTEGPRRPAWRRPNCHPRQALPG